MHGIICVTLNGFCGEVMALIPQWRQWWKLYSTWFFVLLGVLGMFGDQVDAALQYLDLPSWVRLLIYAAFAAMGIYSRLKLQNIPPRNDNG